jgi:hypothetical protein
LQQTFYFPLGECVAHGTSGQLNFLFLQTIAEYSCDRRNFPRAHGGGVTLFVQFLLRFFANRCEVQGGLDVLFERGQLFAADALPARRPARRRGFVPFCVAQSARRLAMRGFDHKIKSFGMDQMAIDSTECGE